MYSDELRAMQEWMYIPYRWSGLNQNSGIRTNRIFTAGEAIIVYRAGVASPITQSWNLLVEWLKQLETLRGYVAPARSC